MHISPISGRLYCFPAVASLKREFAASTTFSDPPGWKYISPHFEQTKAAMPDNLTVTPPRSNAWDIYFFSHALRTPSRALWKHQIFSFQSSPRGRYPPRLLWDICRYDIDQPVIGIITYYMERQTHAVFRCEMSAHQAPIIFLIRLEYLALFDKNTDNILCCKHRTSAPIFYPTARRRGSR